MTRTPILYDQHMHTPLCKHSVGEPGEYAAHAHKRGLQGIVVTCHNPLPEGYSGSVRMGLDQWDEYQSLVGQATEQWADRVDVRLGLEADYVPGFESFLEKQIQSAPLNHVLGSIHPHLPEYRKANWQGDPVQFHKDYFTNLVVAAQSGLFDTLSHPDLVKNCYLEHWNLDVILDHVLDCLDKIAKTGVAMELNTSGVLKASQQFNPGPWILTQMCERGIACVIGSDAHRPDRVADGFETAMDVLEIAGYTHVSFFLDRKRQDIALATARESLIPLKTEL